MALITSTKGTTKISLVVVVSICNKENGELGALDSNDFV